MNGTHSIEAVETIFDIGGIRNSLAPCYIEWLSRILKKGYWRITAIPFLKIVEKKRIINYRSVYDCGYYYFYSVDGFKGHPMCGRGDHWNLHQAIHCLNKYRGVRFDDIEIEYWVARKSHWDILAKNSEKTIVVQLGNFSYSDYEASMSQFGEFWFCAGKGKGFFYCLKKVSEISPEDSLGNFMCRYFNEKACCSNGQSYNCGNYSPQIRSRCDGLKKWKVIS